MYYFPLNINDFFADTRHLSLLEVGIYTSLMLLYYQTEHPIKADELNKLYRKLSIKSEDHQKIVKDLLDEFCELNDGYYHWHKIDSDVAKYKQNIQHKSAAGKKSAEKKKKNSMKTEDTMNTSSTGVHNQEPITEKQQPINQKNINQKLLNNRSEPALTLETLSLEDLLKLWSPELEEVNQYLKASHLSNLSLEEFDRNRSNFLSYYSHDIIMQKLDGTKLMGKFVSWIQRQNQWKENQSKLVASEGKSPWNIPTQQLEKLA